MKNKIELKGVLHKLPYTNNGRIYNKDVFKNKINIMTLNVEVKPRIESAIEGGYIDKILDMIDDEIIENYIRKKKLEKIINNIKK